MSFYIGEAFIKQSTLYRHKGGKSAIKPGMVAEAKIITRKGKMFYYLLEKVNLN